MTSDESIMGNIRSLPVARKRTLSLLRKYLSAAEEARTPLLRALAGALVDARQFFERADGSPDWMGRTHAYRVFIRGVYEEAGVARDDQPPIQAAVRYRVGAVLRERLDDRTLEEYGLLPHSPRERSHDRRESKSALLSALTSRDLHGGALLAISTAWTVLSKVELRALDDLDEREAAVAKDTLRDLQQRVNALTGRLLAP